MNTVYTVQWRYCDNSGCGVSVVCPDKESAQFMADLLKGEGNMREFEVAEVPYGSFSNVQEQPE
jgi:hypothetical protein